MCRRKIAFLLPAVSSALISFVACLFDILISFNVVNGDVYLILLFEL